MATHIDQSVAADKIRFVDAGLAIIPREDVYLEFSDALQRIHPDAAVFWDRDIVQLHDPFTIWWVERTVRSGFYLTYGIVHFTDYCYMAFEMFDRDLKWYHYVAAPF